MHSGRSVFSLALSIEKDPGARRGVRPSWGCSTGSGPVAARTRQTPPPITGMLRRVGRAAHRRRGLRRAEDHRHPMTVVLVAADGEWTRRPRRRRRRRQAARRTARHTRSTTCRKWGTRSGCATTTRVGASNANARALREELETARRTDRGRHDQPTTMTDALLSTAATDAHRGLRARATPTGRPSCWSHGWPDSHVLWDGVVPLLAEKFRVIRYDNRGAGASSVPKPVSSYTMARLADDFAAVIAELCPGQPVHVLAHDWGSAGHVGVPGPAWRRRPGGVVHLGVRPGADHFSRYVRDGLKRPYRPKLFSRTRLGRPPELHGGFSVPVLRPGARCAPVQRALQPLADSGDSHRAGASRARRSPATRPTA